MISNCPYCRRELDLMTVFQEGDQAAIIRLLPSFGRHANVVMGYCYQFGVSPLSLKAKKLRNLLTEIKTLFDTETFSYEKRRYRISQAGIAEALAVVEKRSFHAPLDSHNYLKKIMIGIADREARESGKQAERDLRGREGRLMAGLRGDDADDETRTDDPARLGRAPAAPYPVPEEQIAAPSMKSVPPAELTPEQIAENKRRIRALAESLAKRGES